MDKSTHLQMATRIHFALLRQFGENIDIADLIKNQGDAREALWVCEASDDIELVDLARQFRACSRALAQAATTPEKEAAKAADAAAAQAHQHPHPSTHTHPIGRPVGRVPSKNRDASTKATPNLDLSLSHAPGLDPTPPPVVRSRMLPPAWFRRASAT